MSGQQHAHAAGGGPPVVPTGKEGGWTPDPAVEPVAIRCTDCPTVVLPVITAPSVIHALGFLPHHTLSVRSYHACAWRLHSSAVRIGWRLSCSVAKEERVNWP
jgi:hypothetical protein